MSTRSSSILALLVAAGPEAPALLDLLSAALEYERLCVELAMLCTVPRQLIAERLQALAAREPGGLRVCGAVAREQLMAGDEQGWAARAILGLER